MAQPLQSQQNLSAGYSASTDQLAANNEPFEPRGFLERFSRRPREVRETFSRVRSGPLPSRRRRKKWAERVTNEFWALGDRERQLGITLSPLCDRYTDSNVPESQIGFFKFICVPFYSIVADLIDPTMLPWLRVQAHLKAWEELSQREAEGGRATSGGDGGGGDRGCGEGGGGESKARTRRSSFPTSEEPPILL